MNDIELNHLKYFYVVAKEGSFTRAAQSLRVRQPAISKMVQLLEGRIGQKLIERQTRSLSLTPAGEQTFRRCESIFGELDRLVSDLRQSEKECSGPLRFGASDSVASHLLARVLKTYLKNNPKVVPSVFTGTSNSICDEILSNRAEFGIFFTAPESELLEFEDLAELKFELVISSAHVKDERVKNCFIGSRDVDYPKGRSFPVMEMLRTKKLKPEVGISSNNLHVHRELVLKGVGFAVLPEFLVRSEIESGKLKILYPQMKLSYGLKLVKRRHKEISKNATVFLDELKKSLIAR